VGSPTLRVDGRDVEHERLVRDRLEAYNHHKCTPPETSMR
jgi:hypothetical protein